METAYHVPVLLPDAIEGMNLQPGGTYVDVTFGGGGHTRLLLEKLQGGKAVAFDRDPDARENIIEDSRLTFVAEDFQFIENILVQQGFAPVDGILADLGVSSHQFDTAERGFSFRFDAPLDMRMNPTKGISAMDMLYDYPEAELLRVFREYGELPNARRVVRLLVGGRSRSRIETTRQLEALIQPCIPPREQAKYLAQVYQAMRIEVNEEMASLEGLLRGAEAVLRPGGRLVVIAYHSLEDRMVKRFLRAGNLEGVVEKDFYGKPLAPWKLITRKPIFPTDAEIAANPRARSARMRIAEKI